MPFIMQIAYRKPPEELETPRSRLFGLIPHPTIAPEVRMAEQAIRTVATVPVPQRVLDQMSGSELAKIIRTAQTASSLG